MRTPTVVVAALVLAVSALASRTPPPACAVAVVDLGKVYRDHPKLKSMEQSLKDGAEALNARAQKDQAELKRQVQDLEARFDPASEEYEKGYRTLQLRMAELDFDLKREGQRLQEKRSRNLANLYKEIAAEAERIAVEKGITCVLIRDGEDVQVEDQGKVLSAEAVRQQMILRTVLWADPALDLTKEVLAALQK